MKHRGRGYALYVLGLLTTINFFNYVDRLVIVTMYDGLRARFGFSDEQLGAFWMAFFTVHALATFPLGWASDHFDRRKIIGFGVIAWSLATLGAAYAWGFWSMLVLRGAIGIGEAAYGPPANALLCEVFPQKKATVVAVFNVGMFAGACVGLAVGGLVGFPRAFQIVAIPGIFLGLLTLTLDVPPERTAPADRPKMRTMLRDGLRCMKVPTLKWMLPAAILISFSAGGYISWIVDFTLRYKGLTLEEATKIYFIITLIAGVTGVLSAGALADWLMKHTRAGRGLTVGIGFACAVPFAILVLFIHHGWPYYLVGFMLLYFLPWYNGPMAAIIDDVVDDADAGTAQATFVVLLHLAGTGPAGFIMGVVSSHYDLRTAFILPPIATLLAAIFAFIGSRHVVADMKAKEQRAAARELGSVYA